MIGIMLGLLLSALDATIVGPAMPRIIGDLGGFQYYAWVTTVYLLTSTITVPIFGKLGDMYGRKWFYVAGIIVFVGGSMLCGLSANITQLIVFRGIQGIGGGIMVANAFTIIADLVPPSERGRWQGLFGGVWGLASVIGPTIGGNITDNIGWKWVFYVNVPVGIIALAVLLTTFPALRPLGNKKRSLDWLGALTLTASMVPLLVALSLGGSKDWAWASANTLGLLAFAAVFLVIFLFVESRAAEPIIPLDLFKNRTFTLSTISVFLTGLGLFGATLYISLFIQAVQGDSATNAGNAITPMMLTLIFASVISGQLLSRTGKYRVLGVVGMTLFAAGMFLLSTMDLHTARWQTIAYMMVLGLGLGVAMPLYNLIVQNAFPPNRVGVVTSSITFFRSIGGAAGVAILGAIVNNRFQTEFINGLTKLNPTMAKSIPVSFTSDLTPQALVNKQAQDAIQAVIAQHVPPQFVGPAVDAVRASMKDALAAATSEVFLIGGSILIIAIIATALLKEIPLRKTNARTAVALAEGPNPEAAAESQPQQG